MTRRPSLVRACVVVTLVTTVAHAQTATPSPLTVHIDAPTAGVVDGDLTVQLSATVSDATVRTALLSVNGVAYEVPVSAGRIEQQVVVVPGNNRVAVSVARGAATAREATTFFLRGPRVDLVVVLGWASRGEIIDLWTREPSGETCKWDHRETAAGGRLLDFSQDAIGFGSQAYVLPTVRPGRYRVKVHYWGSASSEDSPAMSTWFSSIGRLGALDARLAGPTTTAALVAERATVLSTLDRWARPAAPQTPVHAEIVLFPNSVHERRWRFDRTPQRDGELATLGEVEVTAAMIHAARSGEVAP